MWDLCGGEGFTRCLVKSYKSYEDFLAITVHIPATVFGIGSGVFLLASGEDVAHGILLNVSLQLTPIAGVDTMVDTRKARSSLIELVITSAKPRDEAYPCRRRRHALAVSKTSPC